jgi:hypothetical protein
VRERRPAIPLLLITGYAGVELLPGERGDRQALRPRHPCTAGPGNLSEALRSVAKYILFQQHSCHRGEPRPAARGDRHSPDREVQTRDEPAWRRALSRGGTMRASSSLVSLDHHPLRRYRSGLRDFFHGAAGAAAPAGVAYSTVRMWTLTPTHR